MNIFSEIETKAYDNRYVNGEEFQSAAVAV